MHRNHIILHANVFAHQSITFFDFFFFLSLVFIKTKLVIRKQSATIMYLKVLDVSEMIFWNVIQREKNTLWLDDLLLQTTKKLKTVNEGKSLNWSQILCGGKWKTAIKKIKLRILSTKWCTPVFLLVYTACCFHNFIDCYQTNVIHMFLFSFLEGSCVMCWSNITICLLNRIEIPNFFFFFMFRFRFQLLV